MTTCSGLGPCDAPGKASTKNRRTPSIGKNVPFLCATVLRYNRGQVPRASVVFDTSAPKKDHGSQIHVMSGQHPAVSCRCTIFGVKRRSCLTSSYCPLFSFVSDGENKAGRTISACCPGYMTWSEGRPGWSQEGDLTGVPGAVVGSGQSPCRGGALRWCFWDYSGCPDRLSTMLFPGQYQLLEIGSGHATDRMCTVQRQQKGRTNSEAC